jgi:probable HAF family extracellular repeat protein
MTSASGHTIAAMTVMGRSRGSTSIGRMVPAGPRAPLPSARAGVLWSPARAQSSAGAVAGPGTDAAGRRAVPPGRLSPRFLRLDHTLFRFLDGTIPVPGVPPGTIRSAEEEPFVPLRLLTLVTAALTLTSVVLAGPARAASGPAYALTDLGTLGGPSSMARKVNDRGSVIGQAAIADGTSHAFLWRDGQMIDLGTLGGRFSSADALSELDHVVGVAQTADGLRHAFLWQDGRMVDLGTLGGQWSAAADVNDRGQVVGVSQTDAGTTHAVLWRDGQTIDLGTLGGDRSDAKAINGRGQITGQAATRDGEIHAFIWQDGQMTDLGTLGGGYSQPVDITEEGYVVGSSASADGAPHAFLWKDGRMIDLGAGGGWSMVGAQAGGLIAGSLSKSRGPLRAALWQGGELVDLGTLGHTAGAAVDVNRAGTVIGTSSTPMGESAKTEQRPFIWREGKMLDLSSLVTNADGWALDAQLAGSVNGSDWVVGSAINAGGVRAVLLRPTATNDPGDPDEDDRPAPLRKPLADQLIVPTVDQPAPPRAKK